MNVITFITDFRFARRMHDIWAAVAFDLTSVCTRLRDLGLTHIKDRPLQLGIVFNERCLVPASP